MPDPGSASQDLGALLGELAAFCLAISAALEVVRPDALFLFTKTAGSLLAAHLGTGTELLAKGVFSLVSVALAVDLGGQGIEGLRLG